MNAIKKAYLEGYKDGHNEHDTGPVRDSWAEAAWGESKAKQNSDRLEELLVFWHERAAVLQELVDTWEQPSDK